MPVPCELRSTGPPGRTAKRTSEQRRWRPPMPYRRGSPDTPSPRGLTKAFACQTGMAMSVFTHLRRHSSDAPVKRMPSHSRSLPAMYIGLSLDAPTRKRRIVMRPAPFCQFASRCAERSIELRSPDLGCTGRAVAVAEVHCSANRIRPPSLPAIPWRPVQPWAMPCWCP